MTGRGASHQWAGRDCGTGRVVGNEGATRWRSWIVTGRRAIGQRVPGPTRCGARRRRGRRAVRDGRLTRLPAMCPRRAGDAARRHPAVVQPSDPALRREDACRPCRQCRQGDTAGSKPAGVLSVRRAQILRWRSCATDGGGENARRNRETVDATAHAGPAVDAAANLKKERQDVEGPRQGRARPPAPRRTARAP